MEIEKVIRIVGTFIAIAGFATFIVSQFMFPDSSTLNPHLLLPLGLSLIAIWRPVFTKKNKNNPHSTHLLK